MKIKKLVFSIKKFNRVIRFIKKVLKEFGKGAGYAIRR